MMYVFFSESSNDSQPLWTNTINHSITPTQITDIIKFNGDIVLVNLFSDKLCTTSILGSNFYLMTTGEIICLNQKNVLYTVYNSDIKDDDNDYLGLNINLFYEYIKYNGLPRTCHIASLYLTDVICINKNKVPIVNLLSNIQDIENNDDILKIEKLSPEKIYYVYRIVNYPISLFSETMFTSCSNVLLYSWLSANNLLQAKLINHFIKDVQVLCALTGVFLTDTPLPHINIKQINSGTASFIIQYKLNVTVVHALFKSDLYKKMTKDSLLSNHHKYFIKHITENTNDCISLYQDRSKYTLSEILSSVYPTIEKQFITTNYVDYIKSFCIQKGINSSFYLPLWLLNKSHKSQLTYVPLITALLVYGFTSPSALEKGFITHFIKYLEI